MVSLTELIRVLKSEGPSVAKGMIVSLDLQTIESFLADFDRTIPGADQVIAALEERKKLLERIEKLDQEANEAVKNAQQAEYEAADAKSSHHPDARKLRQRAQQLKSDAEGLIYTANNLRVSANLKPLSFEERLALATARSRLRM